MPEIEIWFWAKLVLTAGIVVSASVVVERAGPFVGALVATLPVTVWPAYLFLSLDHDAAYLAASARSSLAATAGSAVFMLLHAVLARRHGLVVSLVLPVACWIALARLVTMVPWSTNGALLLNLAAFGGCIALSGRLGRVEVPRLARAWYELPLRAALVCLLMAAVLGLSRWADADTVGLLAAYPISTTCMMFVLHARLGGRVSAAVVANGLWGMAGIGLSLYALATASLLLDEAAALALALVVPLGWSASVWAVRRRVPA